MAHWRSTPGHAWLILNNSEIERMPACARRPEYEEDVEWSIAILGLPELAKDERIFQGEPEEVLRHAHQVCRDYYPDMYEKLTGEKATPENSLKRRENAFDEEHFKDLIVICAFGDWKEGVPEGCVLGYATVGGNRKTKDGKYFLIEKGKYDRRLPFGYVITTDDLEVVEQGNIWVPARIDELRSELGAGGKLTITDRDDCIQKPLATGRRASY